MAKIEKMLRFSVRSINILNNVIKHRPALILQDQRYHVFPDFHPSSYHRRFYSGNVFKSTKPNVATKICRIQVQNAAGKPIEQLQGAA